MPINRRIDALISYPQPRPRSRQASRNRENACRGSVELAQNNPRRAVAQDSHGRAQRPCSKPAPSPRAYEARYCAGDLFPACNERFATCCLEVEVISAMRHHFRVPRKSSPAVRAAALRELKFESGVAPGAAGARTPRRSAPQHSHLCGNLRRARPVRPEEFDVESRATICVSNMPSHAPAAITSTDRIGDPHHHPHSDAASSSSTCRQPVRKHKNRASAYEHPAFPSAHDAERHRMTRRGSADVAKRSAPGDRLPSASAPIIFRNDASPPTTASTSRPNKLPQVIAGEALGELVYSLTDGTMRRNSRSLAPR